MTYGRVEESHALIDKMIPTVKMYHGSVKEIKGDYIIPNSPNMGHLLKSPVWSVFMWKDKDNAYAWALYYAIRTYAGNNVKLDTTTSPIGTVMLYDDYEKIYNKVKGKKCYVYTVEVPVNKIGLGQTEALPEYTSDEKVKIVKRSVTTIDLPYFRHFTKPVSDDYRYNANFLEKILHRGLATFLMHGDKNIFPVRSRMMKMAMKDGLKPGKYDISELSKIAERELEDIMDPVNEYGIYARDVKKADVGLDDVQIPKDSILFRYDDWLAGKTRMLLITGFSGSGKTTLGKKLAKKFNVAFYEMDKLKDLFRKYIPNFDQLEGFKRQDAKVKALEMHCIATKTRAIAEGGALAHCSPDALIPFTFIIVGTGITTSSFRMLKRTFADREREAYFAGTTNPVKMFLFSIFNSIPHNMQYNLKMYGEVRDLRKEFLDRTESEVITDAMYPTRKGEYLMEETSLSPVIETSPADINYPKGTVGHFFVEWINGQQDLMFISGLYGSGMEDISRKMAEVYGAHLVMLDPLYNDNYGTPLNPPGYDRFKAYGVFLRKVIKKCKEHKGRFIICGPHMILADWTLIYDHAFIIMNTPFDKCKLNCMKDMFNKTVSVSDRIKWNDINRNQFVGAMDTMIRFPMAFTFESFNKRIPGNGNLDKRSVVLEQGVFMPNIQGNMIHPEPLYETAILTSKPVFVVFKRDLNSMMHTIITKATKSYWGHVAISFDPSLDKMYSFLISQNGFGVERFRDYKPEWIINVMCCLVSFDVHAQMVATVNRFGRIKDKTSYGFKNFISCLTKVANDDSQLSMVCSNFVDLILKAGNISPTKMDFSTIHPGRLARAMASSKKTGFFSIFRGRVGDYNPKHIVERIRGLSLLETYVITKDDIVTEASTPNRKEYITIPLNAENKRKWGRSSKQLAVAKTGPGYSGKILLKLHQPTADLVGYVVYTRSGEVVELHILPKFKNTKAKSILLKEAHKGTSKQKGFITK